MLTKKISQRFIAGIYLILFSLASPCLRAKSTPATKKTADKEFVVVIASYNNAKWYKRNLDTLFSQNYDPKKYRVLYTDDCSTDGTAKLVEEYIKERGLEDRFTLIKNKSRRLAMENHYRAMHLCKDHEIILNYDGDDFFANDDVMSLINKIYTTKDVWITNGSHFDMGANKRGYARAATQKTIDSRYRGFTMGQLRTFYAWLFKQIRLKDFVFHSKKFPEYAGQIYPAGCDNTFFDPMLDMAGIKHYQFVKEITYLHNRTALSDKVARNRLLIEATQKIWGQPRKPYYQEREKPLIGYMDQFKKSSADVLIIGNHASQALASLLKSLNHKATGINKMYVIENNKLYCNTEQGIEPSKKSLLDVLNSTDSQHLIIATENDTVNFDIDAHRAILDLEETFAYAAHLNLDREDLENNKITIINAWNNLHAWCVKYDTKLHKNNNSHLTLYRKKDLATSLGSNISAHSLNNIVAPQENIVLCYDHSVSH